MCCNPLLYLLLRFLMIVFLISNNCLFATITIWVVYVSNNIVITVTVLSWHFSFCHQRLSISHTILCISSAVWYLGSLCPESRELCTRCTRIQDRNAQICKSANLSSTKSRRRSSQKDRYHMKSLTVNPLVDTENKKRDNDTKGWGTHNCHAIYWSARMTSILEGQLIES